MESNVEEHESVILQDGHNDNGEILPVAVSDMTDFNYCFNCFKKVTSGSDDNSKRKGRDNDKVTLNTVVDEIHGKTLLEILELIFNISKDLEQQQDKCFDSANLFLCSQCYEIANKMYKLFLEFCYNSKSPSFMNSIFSKYKLKLRIKEEEAKVPPEYILPDSKALTRENDKDDIKEEETGVVEVIDKVHSRPRPARSCANIKNYKRFLEPKTISKIKDDKYGNKKPFNKASRPNYKRKNDLSNADENILTLPLRKKNIKDTSHLGTGIKGEFNNFGSKKLAHSQERKAALQRRLDRLKRMKNTGSGGSNIIQLPIKLRTKSSSTSIPRNYINLNQKRISCDYCCAKFSKRSHYVDHQKIHESNEYTSSFCNGTFNSVKNLKKHITLYHREHSKSKTILERQFVCSECGFPFTRKSHLKSHLEQQHQITQEIETQNCPVCQRKFPTQKSLDLHLSSVHVPKILERKNECEECNRKFLKKSDLRNHMTTHTNIRLFMCEVCGFKSKRPQDLTRHRKLVHLKEINYTCDICEKGFLSPWQLKAHKLTHEEKKGFPCLEPNCGKAFRCPNNLRQHMYVHQGIKHICHICGESYSRTAYLHRHIKINHLGVEEQSKTKNKRNEPQIIYITSAEDMESLNDEHGQHLQMISDPNSLTESLENDLLTSVATEVIVHEIQDETIELNELDLTVEDDDEDATQHVILDDEKYEEVIMEYIIT